MFLELTILEDENILKAWKTQVRFYQSQIYAQQRDYAESIYARVIGNSGFQTHPHGENPAPGILLAADLTKLVQDKSMSVVEMLDFLTAELTAHIMQRSRVLLTPKHQAA